MLPGYDIDLLDIVWSVMDDGLMHEDYLQYWFKWLMDLIGFALADVARWSDLVLQCPARNRLVLLLLWPAPVIS